MSSVTFGKFCQDFQCLPASKYEWITFKGKDSAECKGNSWSFRDKKPFHTVPIFVFLPQRICIGEQVSIVQTSQSFLWISDEFWNQTTNQALGLGINAFWALFCCWYQLLFCLCRWIWRRLGFFSLLLVGLHYLIDFIKIFIKCVSYSNLQLIKFR